MTIPEKYKGHGIHVFCNKKGCRKTISSKKARCNHKDVLARNCPFREQHVFQSRIWNPYTKVTDCIKSWRGKNFKEAYEAHLNYKKELESNEYNIIQPDKEVKPVMLKSCVKLYGDYLDDIGIEIHEKKNLSDSHVRDQKRYLKDFLLILKNSGFEPGKLLINSISAKMVAAYYQEILNRDHQSTTFNHSMKAIKYFFDYFIENKKYDIVNPFQNVKYKSIVHDAKIIRDEEFEKLMEVITPDNGITIKSKKTGEKVDYYRPWLKDCLKAYLLIGGRGQEMVSLTWQHVGKDFITVPNFKISKGTGKQLIKDYVFITEQLAELLVKLGANEYTGSENYLLAPDRIGRNSLKLFISKAFTHFWQFVSKQSRTIHNLRGSYETKMFLALGDIALEGKHKNKRTTINHYISKEETRRTLKGKKVFNIDV